LSTPQDLGPKPDTSIPRLTLEDMPPQLARALTPRVERLGYLGEFFQCVAHQPDALLSFVEYTEAAKSGLEERIVELIALTVASLTKNDYERNQHERLAVRLGLGRAWVEAVERLVPDELDADDERVVQAYLLEAVPTNGHCDRPVFAEVVHRLGSPAAVAVMLVAGRYLMHALTVNTLALHAPVPSIFEDGFDGD
jgi:alkylhydroperoxidase family enzyme